MIQKDEGQSTIEFLLVFVFIIGFIFSFAKLSLFYTNGFLVHYATFMASRAYMVVDTNSNQPAGSDGAALAQAKKIFREIPLNKFIEGYDMNLKDAPPDAGGVRYDRNLYVGVYTDFSQDLITPTLIGAKKDVQLRSESFLGRSPTRAECMENVCKAMQLLGGDCVHHSTMVDNGC